MSIGTYAELKTAIPNWMARTGDVNITGNAADFVTLGEARLNRVLKNLRVMKTSTTLTGVTSSRSLTLPTDYRSPIGLFLTTYGVETRLIQKVFGGIAYSLQNAPPQAWVINGLTIDLDSLCDQAHTFTFRYRQKFGLTDALPTNWLLTNHPDVYLAACLAAAYSFNQMAAKASGWDAVMGRAIGEITDEEADSDSGAELSTDPMLVGTSSSGRRGGYNINIG